MPLIGGKCQSCLCFAFFTSIAAATMVALAIFWTLSSAIFEGGFPTVISLRGRQHFWICSFLVSIDWRSQHNLSKYLVDGISSALKKLSLYFKQRCVLWILGLPGKKVNFSLLNSLILFFFLVVVFLSCFVFVVFYWSKMCCTSFQN